MSRLSIILVILFFAVTATASGGENYQGKKSDVFKNNSTTQIINYISNADNRSSLEELINELEWIAVYGDAAAQAEARLVIIAAKYDKRGTFISMLSRIKNDPDIANVNFLTFLSELPPTDEVLDVVNTPHLQDEIRNHLLLHAIRKGDPNLARSALALATQLNSRDTRLEAIKLYNIRNDEEETKAIAIISAVLHLPEYDDEYAVNIGERILKNSSISSSVKDVVVKGFSNPNPTVRIRAIKLHQRIGGGLATSPHSLFIDPSPRVRMWAYYAAERGSEKYPESAPLYIEALDSKIAADRMAAVIGLGKHESFGSEAAPKLLAISQGPNKELATAAQYSYLLIAPPSEEAVKYIMNVISSSDHRNRSLAVATLKKMETFASSRIDDLCAIVNRADNDAKLRAEIIISLPEAAYSSECLAQFAVSFASSDDPIEYRKSAINALGKFSYSRSIETFILHALDDENTLVQAWALIAVSQMQAMPELYIDIALKKAQSDMASLRRLAIQALGNARHRRDIVAKAIATYLEDPDQQVRQKAEAALSHAYLSSYPLPESLLTRLLQSSHTEPNRLALQRMGATEFNNHALSYVIKIAQSNTGAANQAMNTLFRSLALTPEQKKVVLRQFVGTLNTFSADYYYEIAGFASAVIHEQDASDAKVIMANLVGVADRGTDDAAEKALDALYLLISELQHERNLVDVIINKIRHTSSGRVRTKAIQLVSGFSQLEGDTALLLLDTVFDGDKNLSEIAQPALSRIATWTPDLVTALVRRAEQANHPRRANIIATMVLADKITADIFIRTFLAGTASESELLTFFSITNRYQNSTAGYLPQLMQLAEAESQPISIRLGAIRAMGRAGRVNGNTVRLLTQFLVQPEYSEAAVSAIERIGPSAHEAIPVLAGLLARKDIKHKKQVISALGAIGRASISATRELLSYTEDDHPASIRIASISSLAAIAPPSRDAALKLAPLCANPDTEIALSATNAIIKIGASLNENGGNSARKDLSEIAGEIARLNSGNCNTALERLYELLERLNSLNGKGAVEIIIGIISSNKYIQAMLLIVASYSLLVLSIGIVWLVSPLTIYRLAKFSRKSGLGGVAKVVVPFLLLYAAEATKRVIDSWIASRLPDLRKNSIASFRNNMSYMNFPVLIEGELCTIDAELMRRILSRNSTILAIIGGGGIGKTTLAIQMACNLLGINMPCMYGHAVVPVLLGTGLSREDLIETLRQKLSSLSGEEFIGDKFILEMLRTRRLIPIIDALSELPLADQKRLVNDMELHSEAAFIVTSRILDSLGQLRVIELRMPVLQSSALANFIDFRIKIIQQDMNISSIQRYEACIKILHLMGERPATPLLAGMYIDIFSDAIQKGNLSELPRTIPDLILEFVNAMNKKIRGDSKANQMVQKVMKTIARCCIEPDYFPQRRTEDDILKLISIFGDFDIDYLVSNSLIERESPRYITICHDTVCEYLAAMAITDDCEETPAKWPATLDNIRRKAEEIPSASGFPHVIADVIARDIQPPDQADTLLKRLLPYSQDQGVT